jgi:DNA integrity scanning protein DisA with diadenylate cyclase activity
MQIGSCDGELTILDQDIQALLDQQLVIKDYKAAGERENIVTRANLEKLANSSLQDVRRVSYPLGHKHKV